MDVLGPPIPRYSCLAIAFVHFPMSKQAIHKWMWPFEAGCRLLGPRKRLARVLWKMFANFGHSNDSPCACELRKLNVNFWSGPHGFLRICGLWSILSACISICFNGRYCNSIEYCGHYHWLWSRPLGRPEASWKRYGKVTEVNVVDRVNSYPSLPVTSLLSLFSSYVSSFESWYSRVDHTDFAICINPTGGLQWPNPTSLKSWRCLSLGELLVMVSSICSSLVGEAASTCIWWDLW
jgi:hypothetical protein